MRRTMRNIIMFVFINYDNNLHVRFISFFVKWINSVRHVELMFPVQEWLRY